MVNLWLKYLCNISNLLSFRSINIWSVTDGKSIFLLIHMHRAVLQMENVFYKQNICVSQMENLYIYICLCICIRVVLRMEYLYQQLTNKRFINIDNMYTFCFKFYHAFDEKPLPLILVGITQTKLDFIKINKFLFEGECRICSP